MRWIILCFLMLLTISSAEDKLILSLPPTPVKKQSSIQECQTQELYVIAWSTHDPTERQKAMLEWLNKSVCSKEEYTLIWNALPVWAGTSDGPLLRAKVMEKAR